MKRTQRTITIMLLALLLGLAVSATVYAAPQRPPRSTATKQRSHDTGCVLSRYPSPNNCRPELRPTPRSDQQRGR